MASRPIPPSTFPAWIHEDGIEARARSLATINAIADSVYHHLDPQSLAERAVDVLIEYIPVSSVALFSVSEAEQELHLMAWRGFSEATLEAGSRLPLNDSLTGYTVTCKDVVTTYDLEHDVHLSSRVRTALLEQGLTGCISFPLLFQQTAIGAVNLIFQETHELTPLERETLLAIGKTIGLALANARYVAQIEAEITERRRVEAELIRHQDHLEELVSARTAELEDANEQLRELIAERDAAARKLVAAQQRAEQFSEAKTIFLSNMSHEMRTPLNVILGYASSMLGNSAIYEGESLPELYRKDIQVLLDNANHLLRLIDDVLDLNRIEAGKLELRLTGVELKPILEELLIATTALLRHDSVALRAELPATLPVVKADPVRVRQITLNLLANAAKFTRQGTITLRAEVHDQVVRIAVIDTGIGISEHLLPNLFERFQQADSGRHGGSGLGLNISKQLTLMHGGEMTVSSKVGEGSTFTFTLPLMEASDPYPSPQPLSRRREKG
ncbi:MAG: ATP-binding protein [Anaerolineae bacterium]